MKRASLILIGIMAVAMLLLAACDDDDTQAEANEDFCDAAGEYLAALQEVRLIDSDSTPEEAEEAVNEATAAYDAMIEASVGIISARLVSINTARDDLQAAIDDIPEDASIGEALESVDDEIEDVALAVAQALNDVACGQESGGDSYSDE